MSVNALEAIRLRQLRLLFAFAERELTAQRQNYPSDRP